MLRFGQGQFAVRLGESGAGMSFDELIQHLSENDPNRYGPPPASKSAIDKLKKHRIEDFSNLKVECSVCLMPIVPD